MKILGTILAYQPYYTQPPYISPFHILLPQNSILTTPRVKDMMSEKLVKKEKPERIKNKTELIGCDKNEENK